MNPEDLQFLLRCLFEPTMSRNRHPELFVEPHRRALHRKARVLTNLKKEMLRSDVEYWTETNEQNELLLRLHQPHLRATRTVTLSSHEWELLHHSAWQELGLS